MKNIELKLHKPYQRDAEANAMAPHKVEFGAEFSDIGQALYFVRALNELIIEFNDNGPAMQLAGTAEFIKGHR